MLVYLVMKAFWCLPGQLKNGASFKSNTKKKRSLLPFDANVAQLKF